MKLRWKLLFWIIAFTIAIGFQKYMDNNWIIKHRGGNPEPASLDF